MSSDRQSDAPSPPPDELGPLVRSRGAPLLEALTEHVPDAEEHADATASYAFIAAVELGFGRDRCELYRDATKLHEIGLVYVPAEIASKPASARTAVEAATFEGHYEAGYRLARGAGIPERVCGWLLRQRERFDGSGPEGLAGDRIPVESRLVRAACVCQTAVATDEPGDARTPLARAEAALGAAAGSELDPQVASALTAVLTRAR
jgi:HD-GYP domain-containing protein (c-di-GMP phosphodiesterase class II)